MEAWNSHCCPCCPRHSLSRVIHRDIVDLTLMLLFDWLVEVLWKALSTGKYRAISVIVSYICDLWKYLLQRRKCWWHSCVIYQCWRLSASASLATAGTTDTFVVIHRCWVLLRWPSCCPPPWAAALLWKQTPVVTFTSAVMWWLAYRGRPSLMIADSLGEILWRYSVKHLLIAQRDLVVMIHYHCWYSLSIRYDSFVVLVVDHVDGRAAQPVLLISSMATTQPAYAVYSPVRTSLPVSERYLLYSVMLVPAWQRCIALMAVGDAVLPLPAVVVRDAIYLVSKIWSWSLSWHLIVTTVVMAVFVQPEFISWRYVVILSTSGLCCCGCTISLQRGVVAVKLATADAGGVGWKAAIWRVGVLIASHVAGRAVVGDDLPSHSFDHSPGDVLEGGRCCPVIYWWHPMTWLLCYDIVTNQIIQSASACRTWATGDRARLILLMLLHGICAFMPCDLITFVIIAMYGR